MRDDFECFYISRHLNDLLYADAKAHVESERSPTGYNRSNDDGHLDDCYYYFLLGANVATGGGRAA